ncbi:MAG: rhomboid family intramembrane serine protease [Acidimicrobiaceae bacterium]|nr:rhomboid family intramembrane serine protease [Acidimicrobiaceae bacterium]
MSVASVGFHCPECVATKSQRVVTGPMVFTPVLTTTLVAFNVAIWLASTVQGTNFFVDYALWGPLVADGEWYRIVTSGFLHDGVFHLGFNCFALWIMGKSLEQFLGRPRFAALYFVSLLGGSLGVLLLEPSAVAVGASGGIFGFFGAMAIVQRSVGVSVWATGLGPILALNLFLTFAVSRISVGGHVGGLVAGGVVGLIYVSLKRANTPNSVAVGSATALGALLVVLSLFLAANPLI